MVESFSLERGFYEIDWERPSLMAKSRSGFGPIPFNIYICALSFCGSHMYIHEPQNDREHLSVQSSRIDRKQWDCHRGTNKRMECVTMCKRLLKTCLHTRSIYNTFTFDGHSPRSSYRSSCSSIRINDTLFRVEESTFSAI